MPEKETMRRVAADKKAGKSASTQAGEFVREEIHHVREGKHGALSTKQMIAIGLSKARRAGVKLKPPKPGTTSAATRKRAKQDAAAGRRKSPPKVSAKRSRASMRRLKRAGHEPASHAALSKHAKAAAKH